MDSFSIYPGSLITLDQLSRFLQVDKRTVRRWVRDGVLPQPVDLHGQKRWRSEVISAWVLKIEVEQLAKKIGGQARTETAFSRTSDADAKKEGSQKPKRD